ncbi:MAG TPA: hypothetical protein VLJ59_17325 [Mycobacteriales bacterium]|nr:hypothetical protein [Mycobacteriales bacterium]
MTTYAETVRQLRPVIIPLFEALEDGLSAATRDHAAKLIRRPDDPHYFGHTVRRMAIESLRGLGLQAERDSGRPALAMSGIMLFFRGMAVRVLRPDVNRHGRVEIPIPGLSRPRQRFWRQDTEAIPGVGTTDNLLLLWTDDAGILVEPLTLVRPLGGDHRRRNLRVDWIGHLDRGMASLREEDLDELRPYVDYRQLGVEGA